MGSNRLRKSITQRRKIHIFRALNSSKSHVKKSKSMFIDSFLYIYLLRLKLEAVKREYSNLLAIKKQYLNMLKNVQYFSKKVIVEKTKEGVFSVKIRCEKKDGTLVSVLQAFEELDLHVLQARVSCNDMSFCMDATTTSTVVAQAQAQPQQQQVTEAIVKAIEKR